MASNEVRGNGVTLNVGDNVRGDGKGNYVVQDGKGNAKAVGVDGKTRGVRQAK